MPSPSYQPEPEKDLKGEELRTEQRPSDVASGQVRVFEDDLSAGRPSGTRRREERFVVGRVVTSVLALVGGATAGATWGPTAAGVALLLVCAAPRRRVSAVAAEFGAALGWVIFHGNAARWSLLGVASVALVLVVLARFVRGRLPGTEARSWGLGLGLSAVGALRLVPIPPLGLAVSWLVLSAWVLTSWLALFTEGFTPLETLRSLRSKPVRERMWGRGSVARNVLAAALATGADFLVFHSLLRLITPAFATLVGCVVGGVLNFGVNQRWAFDSRRTVPAAAMRYLWVSAASAAFNSIAVALALLDPNVSPVAAWMVARGLGFLGWNYPMQRDHVFAHGRGPAPEAVPPTSAYQPILMSDESAQTRRAGRW